MSALYIDEVCPKCNQKMIMYYKPLCLDCTPKAKIKKNLILSIDYIEHKYKIQTRDYAAAKHGVKSSISFNCKRAEEWKDNFAPIPKEYITDPLPNYRFNQKGMDWYKTQEGEDFIRKRETAYRNAPDGQCKEIPYWDWWHMVVDIYDNIRNDCWIIFNWQYVYERCKYDWQREITQLFINEFGKRDIKIEISW